ncbi:SusC/RagA family TonB-linked outer membrane protein [Reichenbachiella ulvae]|uniref:TonB-dependent receptor n=1 Tax=Reichenbachiella ulvae TaxID=2980104 RepID=A0ABT3CUR1_9BACT|nr:TonB-dependent receptor [Reichenbachiella ulvae]MCV9387304.1 TonB-dependent receptor [Reichenbachiella ulvae]
MKEQLLKKLSMLLALCWLVYLPVLAQDGKAVSGVVTSFEDGSPLPGVAVLIEGSNTGTVTDFNGEFSLNASPEDVLVISFVGFKSVKVPVKNQTDFNIILEEDLVALDEVVVVGYGTVKKSDLSGSVSSVKADDIAAFPALSATQTLQGRAAGVQISSNNGGQPGANFNVKIRGGTSINASSDPIVVVDGFVGAEMPPPEDIASVEVLKDASATAIYGSRGANGVIMVTTKKGKAGQIKIDINSSYTTQSPTKQLDLLDADEFTDYMSEFGAYTNLGGNTNWQEEIYRTGVISNNQLSVSGGSDNVTYYLSGTYFDQQGVVIGSDYKRYSLNANVNVNATDFLKIGMSVYGRKSENIGVRTQESSGGSGQAGVTSAALRFNPDLGIYDANGNYSTSRVGDEIDNPVAMATEYDRERVTDRFQSNAYMDFKLTEWLSFKTTLGLGSTNWRDGEYWPQTLIRGRNTGGLAGIEARKQSSTVSENYFTIDKEFGAHHLTWVSGYSYQKNVSEAWESSSQGFISDGGRFWALDQGSAPNFPTSGLTESVIKSFYSRVNYSLQNRYIVTFTGRYDGASNFAKNNKWAFFPSGAVAWDIKSESFMDDVNFMTQFKLRASYGLTGNQAIGPYQSLATLEPTYSIIAGQNALKVGGLANSDLTWETTSQMDIGLDIGILDGRVNFVMDYYEKETRDLLFQRQLPSYVGVQTQLQNIGRVSNKGFEFMVSTKNLVGELTWDTDFIISSNKNEVLELPDSVEFYGESPGHFLLDGTSQLLLEGQPVGVFYGYVYEGIYQTGDTFIPGSNFEQEAGGEKYADISGPDGVPDGQLTADDRKLIGNPHPDFIWSLNNTFGYKNFDLSLFIQGVHGNDMLNFTAMELQTMSGKSNASTYALDRWTPSDPNTDVPKASSARPYRVSSKYIYDASYVRLKNVTLGYTFPRSMLEKVFIRSLRVYVSGQNLLTMTDYPGLDPEVGYQNSGSGGDGNRNIGLDYASYPNVRAYTFGINLGL